MSVKKTVSPREGGDLRQVGAQPREVPAFAGKQVKI